MAYGTFSHKIGYVSIFQKNINLKGHLNHITGSSYGAFAEWSGFCTLVEIHREESAPPACAAGLFKKSPDNFSQNSAINSTIL